MKSFLVSLLFFILAVASLDQAGAFVVTGRSMLPRTLSLAAEAEESSSEAAVAPKEPKPEVKCPDCDLCDGSGRYVDVKFGDIIGSSPLDSSGVEIWSERSMLQASHIDPSISFLFFAFPFAT